MLFVKLRDRFEILNNQCSVTMATTVAAIRRLVAEAATIRRVSLAGLDIS